MIYKWDKSRPPTGAFTLNKGCPQAQGLVGWWPFGNKVGGGYILDIAGRAPVQETNSPNMLHGAYGEGVGNLVAASSQYYTSNALTPITAMPLSMSSWGNADGSTATAFWCGQTANGTEFFRTVLVSNKVRANIGAGGSQSNAITATSYTNGIWNLFGATFTSATSRDVYLNGGNSVNDATNLTPGAPTAIQIGSTILTGPVQGQFFNGQMGECCLWNVALAAEVHQRLYNYRYELWYPLRSPRWISFPSTVTFRPAWAMQSNNQVGLGIDAT